MFFFAIYHYQCNIYTTDFCDRKAPFFSMFLGSKIFFLCPRGSIISRRKQKFFVSKSHNNDTSRSYYDKGNFAGTERGGTARRISSNILPPLYDAMVALLTDTNWKDSKYVLQIPKYNNMSFISNIAGWNVLFNPRTTITLEKKLWDFSIFFYLKSAL